MLHQQHDCFAPQSPNRSLVNEQCEEGNFAV
jgi:hypothetical protein